MLNEEDQTDVNRENLFNFSKRCCIISLKCVKRVYVYASSYLLVNA